MDTIGPRLTDFGFTPSLKSDRSVLLARLQDAAGTQTRLRCIYFGGAKAGVELEIVPIKIDPPDVWAHCVASGRSKRFRLGLIYVLEPGEDPRWARPLEERSVSVRRINGKNLRTLSQLIEECGDTLDALGWRVALSERALALHRITEKDGEAVVSLRHDEDDHWVIESLDNRSIKRRRLGAAANIFLAAAARNVRRTPAPHLALSMRATAWQGLRVLGAAVVAFALGAIVGVLLPR